MSANTKVLERVSMGTLSVDGVIENPAPVEQFRHVYLELDHASSPVYTIKIQGSTAETPPNFSATANDSNPWFYIGSYDTDGQTLVAGSTGYAISSAAFQNLLVSHDNLKWVSIEMSSRSAGILTAYAVSGNNS